MRVVWLKRDLRATDHEPLLDACAGGAVVALYAFEPSLWQQQEHSDLHHGFVSDALKALRTDLASLGIPLVVRVGEMPHLLASLESEVGQALTALYSHEETGLGCTWARDKRVKAWMRERRLPWHERPQHGVFRPHPQRDGWSRRWEARMQCPLHPTPPSGRGLTLPDGVPMGEIPTAAALGVRCYPRTSRQPGGRQRALALLESFLTDRGLPYRQSMSSPLAGAQHCSRLSPHLAWGTVSSKEVWQAARRRLETLRQGREPDRAAWIAAVDAWDSRLRWRDHFAQKLEDEPSLEFYNLNAGFNNLRTEASDQWRAYEQERFEAWCEGRTGVPMVDACMRSVQATGWLNFRMRSMLMSFATHHLWLHWREPARFLAAHFTDFDPGIHYPQAQMQAGTTGINTHRVYNPYKQRVEQDPEGHFVKTWVPELQDVPLRFLDQPHRCPPLLKMAHGIDNLAYPPPIVGVHRAAAVARKRLEDCRSSSTSRRHATSVMHRHGSRRTSRWRRRR